MGAGSSALLWYGLCCGVVGFVGIVASALFIYGQWKDAKAKRAAEERAERRLDPTSDDR